MNTHSTLQPMLVRENMIRDIRAFFGKHHFHEVIVPVFQTGVPLEPTISPFSTTWSMFDKKQTLYLSTSPERYLKKMLSRELGNCYAIGHTFRNLEHIGPYHHPEFLMLEWYREQADFHQIMDDVEHLMHSLVPSGSFHYQGQTYSLQNSFPRLSLEKLFLEYVGIKLAEVLTDKKMQSFVKKRGYAVQNATWEQLFHQIMIQELEPHFPKEPFFLLDFPARLSPLCKRNEKKSYLADRFEFFIAGIEIGNGNTEETDRARILNGFQEELLYRRKTNQLSIPIDEEFLQNIHALTHGPYAGIGLGIDRLAMIMADVADIHAFEVDYHHA
ncbi:MAG: hypothetical protein HZA34_00160 [Candidatus Pacebacteria bacterium]|nr:hypothetical protein [Candidatus Paceibacterota bacterium]